MKKILPLLVTMLAAPTPAFAGLLLDFTAGLSVWNFQPGGHISYQGTDNNLRDNLGLGRNTQVGGWVSLEHPIPLLPNIKLSYTQVSNDGDGTLVANFGKITVGTPVHSQISLNQGDIILYYSPLNNYVKVDLGLDVKIVDGNAKLTSASDTVNKSFTGPVPLLYTNVGVNLPFTGLSANAQGSAIAYGGNHLWDIKGGVSYESSLGIGVTGGYRYQELKLKDINGVNVNTSIQGPYGAVFYHF